jgi:glycine oxidase
VADVVVIGAGVIGAACAWRLAQAGLSVRLLERSAPAAGASQAALGVLQFHAKARMPRPYQRLAIHSRDLYPPMLDELAALDGERLPYYVGGHLSVALLEADLPELDAFEADNQALGLPVERVTPEECRLMEPGLNPAVLSGLFYPEDAWVDNTALTLALARAAERHGARLERRSVEAVVVDGGRATGVRAGGEFIPAGWVVLAAGCWSPQVRGVPALPVVPVRGQALAVQGQPVRRVVSSPRGYIVPKGTAGQALLGATVEHAGYDEETTVGGLAEVAAASLELAPGLRGCAFLGAWAGLRPGTPDGLPFIGPFDEAPNLVAATGHLRNGIMHAPSTAAAVTAVVTGSAPPFDLAPFRPGR